MKVSIGVSAYGSADISGSVSYVQAAEKLGVDSIWSAEAWGQDAVTSLAYLAAVTERIKLGTGIMQISARVPSMTAMTALSLNALSNGRFLLGLGASGPQVVEGLHGQSYTGPLTRLKETVEISRMAFRGEKLSYQGAYHELPRPGGEGKALRLAHPPTEIPIYLATLGPRALEYTGAHGDGWLGTSFSPDHADAHLAYIRKGAKQAGRNMNEIDLQAACTVMIGDNVDEMIASRKPGVAFQMGAMGSAQTNFYNEAFQRAGFADDALAVQQLWLDGKREQAAARVTEDMVSQFQAIGTEAMVRERLRLYRDAGITTLSVRLDGYPPDARLTALEHIMDLIAAL
ncbi:MAG: LLM class flavin-dependent oxidoreductase [Pseudomonadales bacterium]|nr:LLM class flavin-dependent oxidoreductase [Pseudomonadales bacterium]MDP6472351.1 LLM class flavin-dependent oxidoreductase [Pseudomonadales bacterium]MDP6828147.1 LLM class flavin-dependent oxidoreductase [Pseudomonadales bacterium]MDP6973468.1 LLM class flavin-dependent oxidoreductase [Pseudomonadales bacterium]|tara:strand:- start:1178 stop:2209 length:1032 start_codon:yes stop_codon:yes gene_type:complete